MSHFDKVLCLTLALFSSAALSQQVNGLFGAPRPTPTTFGNPVVVGQDQPSQPKQQDPAAAAAISMLPQLLQGMQSKGGTGATNSAKNSNGTSASNSAFTSSAITTSLEGADTYSCPGNGDSGKSGAFNPKKDCDAKCTNLVFDCSQHKLIANGQALNIDGQQYLGCASQTGLGNGSQPHKITSSACGGGKEGHLGMDEPKLLSQPLPCDNCVIHRWYPGADTNGCLGIEPKLFDWVYQTCGGCSYTIVPENGSSTGGSAPSSGVQN